MAKIVPSLDTKRLLERKARLYHDQLEGSRGQKYLEARGITRKVQNSFQLGFVQNNESDDYHLRGRISIPYFLRHGVVGIKYRSIDDSEPKYLSNSGFYAKRFYMSPLTSGDTTVYLCEGELDCITLAQLGVPAVAVPGVENLDVRLWRAFRNRHVVVVADGDDDGQGRKFADKVLTLLDDSAMILMEGHDVNSYFTLHGEEKLLQKIGWIND